MLAKLLYTTKRSRPDIETGVVFLTTRVAKSDVDDWKKLKRIIIRLRQTRGDVGVIGAKKINELFTWVNAAFTANDNIMSQTGGAMSFGHGMIHCRFNIECKE